MVVAAAIGQRTKRMRIGTNLMLLPLADPLRLAEDSATLSILTGGRFDLGVGLGYRQLEFDYFGRKLSHRPSLMEEGVALLRQAWQGQTINHQGKRYQIDGLSVHPVAESPPRLFMGGMAEPAIARAARLGDGFLSTGGIGHDVYVKALEDLGRPRSEGAICAGNWAIIAGDPEAEAAKVGEHVLYQTNQYVSWGAFGPPDRVPVFPVAESAIRDGLYERWDAGRAVTGLVDMLARMKENDEIFLYAAGGFRDFTRIASSNPVMWRDICIANREALSPMLAAFAEEMGELARSIGEADADQLLAIFERAKAARDRYVDGLK